MWGRPWFGAPRNGAPASCRLERRHPAAFRVAAAGSRRSSRLEGGGPSGSGAEPQGTEDHGEAAGDVGGHADDEGPLVDADAVDEVDELAAEEEEVGEDGDVVGAVALPDPQGLRDVGGTGGDTNDGDEPGEE